MSNSLKQMAQTVAPNPDPEDTEDFKRKHNLDKILEALDRKDENGRHAGDLGPLLAAYKDLIEFAVRAAKANGAPNPDKHGLGFTDLQKNNFGGTRLLQNVKDSHFTHFKSGKAGFLKTELLVKDYRALAQWIIEQRSVILNARFGAPQAFAAAWQSQLDAGGGRQDHVLEHAPGIYALYRPSLAHPRKVVLGLFVIFRSGDYLMTFELNRLKESMESPHGVVVGAIVEEHVGFATRKDGSLLIQSFEKVSREQQVAVFTLRKDDDESYYKILDGLYLGILSTTGVTSRPVVLLKQCEVPKHWTSYEAVAQALAVVMNAEPPLDSTAEAKWKQVCRCVDLIDASDVPRIVLARLKAKSVEMTPLGLDDEHA
jgi:hypothetical protein